MEMRQLRYFLVLCEELNYTRAAERLYLSRQALRQSIAALEAEVCGVLFLNTHNHLSLTEKGARVRAHVAPAVAAFSEMQAALYADIRTEHPLRLGISVALVPDYLPTLNVCIERFSALYPGICLSCCSLDNDVVSAGVENGTLDAGLVMDMAAVYPGIARTVLTSDQFCVLVSPGHPFWNHPSLPPAALKGQTVLIPSLRREAFLPLWQACEAAGFSLCAEVSPSYYQAYYTMQQQGAVCISRLEPFARTPIDRVRDVVIEDMPPICASFLQPAGQSSPCLHLLCEFLRSHLRP